MLHSIAIRSATSRAALPLLQGLVGMRKRNEPYYCKHALEIILLQVFRDSRRIVQKSANPAMEKFLTSQGQGAALVSHILWITKRFVDASWKMESFIIANQSISDVEITGKNLCRVLEQSWAWGSANHLICPRFRGHFIKVEFCEIHTTHEHFSKGKCEC